jgi:hypothetical protein
VTVMPATYPSVPDRLQPVGGGGGAGATLR